VNRAERRRSGRRGADLGDELDEVCGCAPVGVFVLLECGAVLPAPFEIEPDRSRVGVADHV
jgi:hypothetical protein